MVTLTPDLTTDVASVFPCWGLEYQQMEINKKMHVESGGDSNKPLCLCLQETCFMKGLDLEGMEVRW